MAVRQSVEIITAMTISNDDEGYTADRQALRPVINENNLYFNDAAFQLNCP